MINLHILAALLLPRRAGIATMSNEELDRFLSARSRAGCEEERADG